MGSLELCVSKTSRVPRKHHFKQYGPLPHFSILVRQCLYQKYATPMDGKSWSPFMASSLAGFDALWLRFMGILEYIVHHEPLNSFPELKTKFTEAIASIAWDTFKKSTKHGKSGKHSIEKRGRHFEHLLKHNNLLSLRGICILEPLKRLKAFRITAFNFCRLFH